MLNCDDWMIDDYFICVCDSHYKERLKEDYEHLSMIIWAWMNSYIYCMLSSIEYLLCGANIDGDHVGIPWR